MRPILALTVLLLLAGCVSKPADTATKESLNDPPAPSETTPSAPAAPAHAPTASNTSAPAAPAAPTTPAAPASAPATPVPWNLTGEVKLGLVAGAGTGGSPQDSPAISKDADHCPDAKFTLPAGASHVAITFTVSDGKGNYHYRLTAPDGTVYDDDTLTHSMPPQAQGVAPPPKNLTADGKLAGEWTAHAEPLGPVAEQILHLQLDVSGTSVVAPTAIPVTPSC